MKERLAIKEERYRYKIGWYFSDEGDFGAMLGEMNDAT